VFQSVPYDVANESVDNMESSLELHVIDRPRKLDLCKSHIKLLPYCISPLN